MGKRERRRRREASAFVASLTGSASPSLRSTSCGVDVLRDLVQRRQDLERAIDCEVDRLAASGVGWPTIAAALGVSRQAVRQSSLRRRQSVRQPQLSASQVETSV